MKRRSGREAVENYIMVLNKEADHGYYKVHSTRQG